jgi:hypothetical protein
MCMESLSSGTRGRTSTRERKMMVVEGNSASARRRPQPRLFRSPRVHVAADRCVRLPFPVNHAHSGHGTPGTQPDCTRVLLGRRRTHRSAATETLNPRLSNDDDALFPREGASWSCRECMGSGRSGRTSTRECETMRAPISFSSACTYSQWLLLCHYPSNSRARRHPQLFRSSNLPRPGSSSVSMSERGRPRVSHVVEQFLMRKEAKQDCQ